MTGETKRCTKCGEVKARSEFNKDARAKDGLKFWCKKCWSEYRAEHREEANASSLKWNRANREKVNAISLAWAKNNPEKARTKSLAWTKANPEKVRAKSLAWAKANPEKVYARNSAWQKAHPEKASARSLRWAKNNPEKATAKSQLRRARKRGAPGLYTDKDVKALYETQGGRCVYCGRDLSQGYHVDHIVPLSRGGSNGPENLALACPKCNESKGAKLLSEWVDRPPCVE